MRGYTINGYLIEEEISSGSFSVVYSAIHLETSKSVCIKKIDKEITAKATFLNEVEIMKRVSHPYIVSMIEYFEDYHNYYLVLEKIKGETLLSFINDSIGAIPEWMLKRIFAQILAVASYLHEKVNIVHRDFKLENIMLDDHFNIKIIRNL